MNQESHLQLIVEPLVASPELDSVQKSLATANWPEGVAKILELLVQDLLNYKALRDNVDETISEAYLYQALEKLRTVSLEDEVEQRILSYLIELTSNLIKLLHQSADKSELIQKVMQTSELVARAISSVRGVEGTSTIQGKSRSNVFSIIASNLHDQLKSFVPELN